MKKILFVCSAGMSTSLLVQKTQAVAEQKGLTLDIAAMSETEAKSHYDEASAILLGPQVRFLMGNIKKAVEGKDIKVEVIDTITYGRMDGEAALAQILRMTEQQ